MMQYMFDTGLVPNHNVRTSFLQQFRHNLDRERVCGGRIGVRRVQCRFEEHDISFMEP
jgi:hypothetical protein